MDTEQAHSPGWTAGHQSAAVNPRLAPATWLNLLCLDAPIVAVAWQWLFARTFRAPFDPVNCAALFLTAWLIYLAGRLADNYSLRRGGPRSLRQEFCAEHRRIWIGALVAIAAADAWLISGNVDRRTLLAGLAVGMLALIYLTLNHSLGRIWHSVPLKEIAIGFLFASGIFVALLPHFPGITWPFLLSGIVFACLCTLNCISIAYWERDLDEAQEKISIATRHPRFRGHVAVLSLGLALGSLAAAIVFWQAALLYACLSISALLLALLDIFRERIDNDQRTALADLVLLTPLLASIVTNL